MAAYPPIGAGLEPGEAGGSKFGRAEGDRIGGSVGAGGVHGGALSVHEVPGVTDGVDADGMPLGAVDPNAPAALRNIMPANGAVGGYAGEEHSFTFPTHPSGLSSAPGRPGSHHDDVYPTGWGGPETDWESHSGGGPGYTSWTSPAAGLDAGTAAGPGAGAAAGRPPAQKQRHDEPPEALAAGAAAKATGSPVGAPLIPVYESGAERGAGMVTGGGPTPIPWEGVPRQARQGAPK